MAQPSFVPFHALYLGHFHFKSRISNRKIKKTDIFQNLMLDMGAGPAETKNAGSVGERADYKTTAAMTET